MLAFTHKTMEFFVFYASHDPREKTVIKIHWKCVGKLKNDVQARCRQATDLSIFVAHVLDGKAKNDKNVIPMEHGNDIFENVIPMLHGKHKKSNILFEICVKHDFCNTSRARTSFFVFKKDSCVSGVV